MNFFSTLSVRWKLALLMTLLIGLISLVIFTYFPNRLKDQANGSLVEKAYGLTEMAAFSLGPGLSERDPARVAEALVGMRKNPDLVYVIVFDASGNLFTSFNEKVAEKYEFRRIPMNDGDELPLGPAGGAQAAPRTMQHREVRGGFSPTGEIFQTTVPVRFHGRAVGRIFAGLSVDRVNEQIRRSRATIALVSLLIFTIGVLAVFALSRLLTGPLSRIAQTAELISAGDTTHRATVTYDDEVGQLARSFNVMVDKLGTAKVALETLNQSLESRVEIRTRELREEIDERTRAEDALRNSEERYRLLFERNLAGVYVARISGQLLSCNDACARIFGYDSGDELMTERGIIAYSDRRERQAIIERLKKEGTVANEEVQLWARNGETVWALENVRLVEGRNGQAATLEGILLDINDRKKAEQDIEYKAYHDALTALPNRRLFKDRVNVALAHAKRAQLQSAVMFLDLDDLKVINDTLGHATGDILLQRVARRIVESVREEDSVARVGGDEFTVLLPAATEQEAAAVARKILDRLTQPLVIEDDEIHVTTSIGIAMYPTDGVTGMILQAILNETHSLTNPSLIALAIATGLFLVCCALLAQESRSRKALRKSEALYREIADHSSDLITRQTEAGVYKYVSPVSTRLLGFAPDSMLGHSIYEYAHADDVPAIREYLAAVLDGPFPHAFSYRMLRRDGGYQWVESTSGTVESSAGREVLAYSRDISERKQIEEHIEYAAYHDELTGLANRTLFGDRLTVALASAQRFGRNMAVFFLDLDHFKRANDTLGHKVGDLLLEETGNRLRDCVRVTDTVARAGGDEFTILLSELAHEDDAARVASKVLESISNRFVLEGHHVYVTASIGVAIFPRDGEDAETLLKNADSAMYRAKNSGRNGYKLCTPGTNARFLERLSLENNLRRAFEREEFLVYYQPMFDTSTRNVVGMEALIRWEDPDRGLLTPADFLNVAEEARLMVPMGEWVLRTACRQARAWQDFGSPVRVSVNLSERQFQNVDLTRTVERALEDADLAPDLLAVEVQESSVSRDFPVSMRAIGALKELGVKVAIDDFGTASSSFSALRKLHVDEVKIASSLLHGLASEKGNDAILSSMISAAHAMNLRVVGKSVESTRQLEFLRANGCPQMQGYLLGQPALPTFDGATLRLDH
ncbi:MAG TPA: diguanylate cyclase [Thermoanaerobaculia bacterium]|nr:diguanylate cyclase [Thermoanaerobaculia bacterium]